MIVRGAPILRRIKHLMQVPSPAVSSSTKKCKNILGYSLEIDDDTTKALRNSFFASDRRASRNRCSCKEKSAE